MAQDDLMCVVFCTNVGEHPTQDRTWNQIVDNQEDRGNSNQ